jgi:hypothetical protein
MDLDLQKDAPSVPYSTRNVPSKMSSLDVTCGMYKYTIESVNVECVYASRYDDAINAADGE